jgi:hypothetical protein
MLTPSIDILIGSMLTPCIDILIGFMLTPCIDILIGSMLTPSIDILIGSIWIGITDMGNEGQWRSITTGERVTYTNWSNGNPNNYKGNQHCGTLNWGGRGKWDDDGCFKKRTFICEARA